MKNAREFFKAMLNGWRANFEEFREDYWPFLGGPICGVLCACIAHALSTYFYEEGNGLIFVIAFGLGWIVERILAFVQNVMRRVKKDKVDIKTAVLTIWEEWIEENRDDFYSH